MVDLRIFDSQGEALDGRQVNQTVKDFFFDGVRFALDMDQNQIFCFLRARDNETARSEQYYALYEYSTRSEMNNIMKAVKKRIEDQHGMILDMKNDDTQFFEALASIGSGRAPGDSATLDDVGELLSNYHQVRLGVGSYDEAHALFSEFSSHQSVDTIAVSDNASGSSISSFDVVIEKGNHQDLELLGDTADEIEELREQRRSEFESEYGTTESGDGISGVEGALLFAGGGVLLIIIAVYGGCLGLGMSVPGLGTPPGIGSCGPAETSGSGIAPLANVSAEMNEPGSQTLVIEGNISNSTSDTARIGVRVLNSSNKELSINKSNRTVQKSGQFKFSVTLPIEEMPSGTYTANVSYANSYKEDQFIVPDMTNESGTPTPTGTTTPTPTESGTPTPTESNTPTPTETITSKATVLS